MNKEIINQMKKRIVILGAGESGAGAAVLAKAKGFDVFVSDFSSIKPKYKDMLDAHGICWEEGRHTEADILNADEIIKSPGIPDKAPIIKKLKEKGTPIISEIEFAGRYTDCLLYTSDSREGLCHPLGFDTVAIGFYIEFVQNIFQRSPFTGFRLRQRHCQ